jgi:hypothetical protein
MDKRISGLLGAVAAVTTVTGAQAATQAPGSGTAALQASSYADLLVPVPNATAALIADNELRAQVAPAQRSEGVKVADDHHHHHHHVIIIKRHRRHHHHHHHHDDSSFIGVPGVGGVVVR